MKKTFFLTWYLFLSILAFGQNKKDTATKATPSETIKNATVKKDSTDNKNKEEQDYGWGDRFALIVGGGIGYTTSSIYDNPVISKTTNFVTLENSNRFRTNLTIGIAYTPFSSNYVRTIYKEKENGKALDTIYKVNYGPRGITYALFINPVGLTKINEGFANSVDLGFGLGWRSGNFLFMATADFFSIRQPRQYFIDEYTSNNKQFVVNSQIQTSLDPNDNTIFKNKLVASVGLKMAFTFDLVKRFYAGSQELGK